MKSLIFKARRFVVLNVKVTALAVLAVLCFHQEASALSYSTSGSPTQIGLGDTIGSSYDQLQVRGASGTIGPSTTSILLNTLVFTAGVNAIVPAVYNGVYSFAETVTLGTSTGNLVVPFNLNISYSDTLTIIGGTTMSFLVGSNLWTLVVNGLTIGPNPGGSEVGYLTAQVSDPPAATPIPAAFVLFGSGLGGIALLYRRRRSREAVVA